MTKHEIKVLSEKISSGIATEEDIQLYNCLCNSFEYELSEWDESIYGNKELIGIEIKEAISIKLRSGHKVVKLNRLRWVAAASVILIVGIATLFILTEKKSTTTITAKKMPYNRFKNEVAPGQDGAILTLANGKTILLDSAGEGLLALQGAAEITKKDGRVVYGNGAGASGIATINTMTTPNGRKYSLVLADGSTVWLNAASSISFPTVFTDSERKVSITGEVYFEIAHDAKKPFIVQKGGLSVQVLGTHFNMNTYDEENSVNITLLEGSVKLLSGSLNYTIKPGQQAQVSGHTMELVNHANTDAIMAWKNELFQFEGENLKVLMRQIARWYDVKVEYSKDVSDLFYAQIPRNTNLSDVLKALELTGKVKFEIDGKKINVLR